MKSRLQLAEPEIYGEDSKGKLKQLLQQKGETDTALAEAKEQWLEVSEDLETAQAE